MAPLRNPRHELFAQEIAKGTVADKAYQIAGFIAHRGNASRLRADESVQRRIGELVAAAAEKAVITVELIARQLLEDRALAHAVKQPGAAVQADAALAKLMGLMPERHEITGVNQRPIQYEDMQARDALAARIAEVAGRLEMGTQRRPH